ncbi:MAG: sulfate transporter family protein [Pseudomonadota bacterium]|nr:sulfate transporter family protein [Pseudomonadota bacterium]
MFLAALRAFSLLASAPVRSVLLRSVGLTLAVLVVFIIAIETIFGALVALPGWVETTMQIVGGLGLVFASVFLVAPVTSLIAGFYLDDIAREVEQRDYAGDPPGRELPTGAAMVYAAKFGLAVIGVNIVALLLLLVPGVNVVAFFAANGYLLGREFFELAAMRYMTPQEARDLRQRNRVRVFLSGLMIAGLVSIPLMNLLTPIFATAFMVHTVKDVVRRGGTAI